MARPAPGSLAARTDLGNRLAFFRKKQSSTRGARASSVGEVTIEIEDQYHQHRHHPPKASPLVDYDSGPSASPTLTLSPTSSPLPGASLSSQSPRTNQSSPGQQQQQPCRSSTLASSYGEPQQQEGGSQRTQTPPFPSVEPLVTLAKRSSPSSTPPEVILRRKQRASQNEESRAASTSEAPPQKEHARSGGRINRSSSNEVGKLLKAALDKHFVTGGSRSSSSSQYHLDDYIAEVFHQLDYHHCGTISREDFETLCEVINISSSPTFPTTSSSTYRNSGLEWLSSYRPRPNSPASPLKLDKLGDVKYRGLKKKSIDPPPNFLFTIGPRPFWELWPQKKRKKRRLTVDEFKRCLLEQWAKSRGWRVSTILPVAYYSRPTVIQSDLIESAVPATARNGATNGRVIATGCDKKTNGIARPAVGRESRSKRLVRSIRRATRRYHFLDRISRRLGVRRRQHATTEHLQNGTSKVLTPDDQRPRCPVHHHHPNREEVDGELKASSSSSMSSTNLNRRLQQHPKKKPASLEEQVNRQQEEIRTLRDVIEDLRSSLQLSDAQNLALQVLLKKMAKAEVQQPDSFRSKMDESEKQLENLVRELKEMSQIRYPTFLLPQQNGGGVCGHGGSSNTGGNTTSSSSANNLLLLLTPTAEDHLNLEQELEQTSQALDGAQSELRATQEELKTTAGRLLQQPESLADARLALDRALQELAKMRHELEEAQTQLETTKGELSDAQEELLITQCQLINSEAQLRETERRLSQISQNRRSLVLELQTTRELLVSSLNKVQDLELESKKVPALEGRIRRLQQQKRQEASPENRQHQQKLLSHPLRPLSIVDSGLYSTSESDQEDGTSRTARTSEGPPPMSSSAPPLLRPLTSGSDTVAKLRMEIESLKEKFVNSERHWQEERNVLLEELIRRQDYQDLSSDVQVLEAQRVRLTLLEEKIKEVLAMLRSLNSMHISSQTLGRLVLDAVERSVDPMSGEIQVFRFLNQLYHSARDFERLTTESQIHVALRAVEEHSQVLADIEAKQQQQRSTSLPPPAKGCTIDV